MMKNGWIIISALSAAVLSGCNATVEAEEDYVRTETATVNINKRGFAEAGKKAVVRIESNTYWIIRVPEECDWLKLSKKAGDGDAEVEVMAEPNIGDERWVMMEIVTLRGGSTFVDIVQESSSESYVYYKSEAIKVADGTTVPLGAVPIYGQDSFILTLTTAASGATFDRASFKLQISRTGERWVDVPFTRSNKSAAEESVYAFRVKSGVEQVFLRFVSVKGDFEVGSIILSESTEGGENLVFYEDNVTYVYHTLLEEDFEWIDPGTGTVFTNSSAGSDGPNFNKQADLHGWTNSYTYVRPGFIKLGTANEAGWMQSPRLSLLGTDVKDVLLEFNAAGYNNDNDLIEITVLNGGLIGNEVSTTINIGNVRVWTPLSVNISGANSGTQIKIGSSKSTAEIKSSGEANRFFLDNVKVSWYEVINLNEQ